MSTKQPSTMFTDLTPHPSTTAIVIPSNIDRNNYVVIDRNFGWTKINCIYKYNIENDKWIKMDGVNNMENMSYFASVLDVKKQILFLFRANCLTQIHLNNNHINTDKYNIGNIFGVKTIIIKDSLFIVGCANSILKWNSDVKTLTTFSVMYNKMKLGGVEL
eukprot:164376_1